MRPKTAGERMEEQMIEKEKEKDVLIKKNIHSFDTFKCKSFVHISKISVYLRSFQL